MQGIRASWFVYGLTILLSGVGAASAQSIQSQGANTIFSLGERQAIDALTNFVAASTEKPAPAASSGHDAALRKLLAQRGITPIVAGPFKSRNVIELGRFLFHDRILSGNRDTSCTTCHLDDFATADGNSLSVGTFAVGLGPDRVRHPTRKFTPRNAPEIFNRGLSEWHTIFWDGRIQRVPHGFLSPADEKLRPGIFSRVLEVQAMFPVLSRIEMRGEPGDRDVYGNINELALIDDDNMPAIWDALMARLLGPEGGRSPHAPSYRELFAAAYPNVPPHLLGFEHAAIALAAFEEFAYTLLDSPWDQYVAGNDHALGGPAKRGALLFFGKAGCANCHAGNLLTDQRHHNLLVPHIGATSLTDKSEDTGRFEETKNPHDRFAFRTPPLRNVAATGPWMHNGAYATLEDAIRHHLDPIAAYTQYNRRNLRQIELHGVVRNTPKRLSLMLPSLSPLAPVDTGLTDADIKHLVTFLEALTSPSLPTLERHIPKAVPSGLPIDRL